MTDIDLVIQILKANILEVSFIDTESNIKEVWLDKIKEKYNIDKKINEQILRHSLTGKDHGAPLDEVIASLGKQEVILRLLNALSKSYHGKYTNPGLKLFERRKETF